MPASGKFDPAAIRQMLSPTLSEDGQPQSLHVPDGKSLNGDSLSLAEAPEVERLRDIFLRDLERFKLYRQRQQTALAKQLQERWLALLEVFPHMYGALVQAFGSETMSFFLGDKFAL